MPKTIRARIATLITALLLIVLTISSGFLYFSLQAQLLRTLDDSLRFNAEQLLARIEDHNGLLIIDRGDVDYPELSKEDDLVRLVMMDGTVTTSQGNSHIVLPALTLQTKEIAFTTVFDKTGTKDSPSPIRLISTPVVIEGQQVTWVYIGRSMEPLTETLNQLLILILSIAPIMLVITTVGGYWLAGLVLRPIEDIRRQAAAISVQNLGKRLNLALPDDEVGRLANTFDQMLARLDESFRAQQRFVSDASHELRTPLAIIRGEVEVTLDRLREPLDYIKSLQSIGEETERMDRLVTNLLWLARSDNTKLILNYETVDLTDMLRVVIELLQPQAAEAGVRLWPDLPPTIPLKADADRLIQLFLNLFENALVYAPDSDVSIRGCLQNDIVKIAIADKGPGIAPEHLPHLFERFYRIDQARSRASGGTGLGLAIAAEIVQAHAGQITVESQPDHGTTFIVTLPTGGPKNYSKFAI